MYTKAEFGDLEGSVVVDSCYKSAPQGGVFDLTFNRISKGSWQSF